MGKNIANFWTETEGIKGELFSLEQLRKKIGGMPREEVTKMLTDMQTELRKQINDLTLYLTNDDPEEGEIGELLKIRANMEGMAKKIDEIMLFKFPNATIIGEPTIQNGQVSDFSTISYLQFPFILDLHNQAFQIDFCFTTATNVQTQQNILDSNFGLALAIQGGRGVMAVSSNGTSWDIGSVTGTLNIQSNTTYYARLIWDRLQYKTLLSTDGVNYTQDMVITNTLAPHPTTIYIGGCDQLETGHAPHPFLGTINLNKAYLSVMGNIVWQGMDDAGLATRLATDLSNLDTSGESKLDEYINNSSLSQTVDVNYQAVLRNAGDIRELQSKESELSQKVVRNEESWGHYTDRDSITLTPKEDNYAVDKNGSKVVKVGWAIAEFTAIKGNTYLFNPGTMDGNVCLFAEKVEKQEVRNIDYKWTYGEDGSPVKVEATYNETYHSYTVSHDEEMDVDVYIDDQSGETLYQLPLTYLATIGTYSPMTILNANAELPADGYCRFVSHFQSDANLTVAVSYNKADADLVMKVLRDGNTASICTQLSNISKRVSSVTERVEKSLEGLEAVLVTI